MNCKLSVEQANAIRRKYMMGNATQSDLATDNHVDVATISDVLNYRTWDDGNKETSMRFKAIKTNELKHYMSYRGVKGSALSGFLRGEFCPWLSFEDNVTLLTDFIRRENVNKKTAIVIKRAMKNFYKKGTEDNEEEDVEMEASESVAPEVITPVEATAIAEAAVEPAPIVEPIKTAIALVAMGGVEKEGLHTIIVSDPTRAMSMIDEFPHTKQESIELATRNAEPMGSGVFTVSTDEIKEQLALDAPITMGNIIVTTVNNVVKVLDSMKPKRHHRDGATIVAIRKRYAECHNYAQVAREFGYSSGTSVKRIVLKLSYAYIDDQGNDVREKLVADIRACYAEVKSYKKVAEQFGYKNTRTIKRMVSTQMVCVDGIRYRQTMLPEGGEGT